MDIIFNLTKNKGFDKLLVNERSIDLTVKKHKMLSWQTSQHLEFVANRDDVKLIFLRSDLKKSMTKLSK